MMRLRLATGLAVGVLCVGAFPGPAYAQDPDNVDQLKQQNADLLAQLKSAQDRKNELNNENTKLQARVGDLEKQLQEHQERAAKFAEQTYLLRAHFAAWENFIKSYPRLMSQWNLFLESNWIGPLTLPSLSDDAASATTTTEG